MKFYYKLSYPGIFTFANDGISLDEKVKFLLDKGAKPEDISIVVELEKKPEKL